MDAFRREAITADHEPKGTVSSNHMFSVLFTVSVSKSELYFQTRFHSFHSVYLSFQFSLPVFPWYVKLILYAIYIWMTFA